MLSTVYDNNKVVPEEGILTVIEERHQNINNNPFVTLMNRTRFTWTTEYYTYLCIYVDRYMSP